MPKFIVKNSGVLVSSDFISDIMPDLNGAFVKVYLYALFLGASGAEVSYSVIADKLGLLESDVLKAFSALESAGVLQTGDDRVCIGKTESAADFAPSTADFAPSRASEQKTGEIPVKRDYSASDMSAAAVQSESLADMFKLAQEVLGKPLNPADTNTLYWLYDGLGYSPEVILMLLEYCVSHEKRGMSYIEKVAVAWHERGVKTIEDVERVIREEADRADIKKSLKQLFGIRSRNLTKLEEDFIDEWIADNGMSEEMIALAYEYSVIQINKLSFPYMNRIIKRWYNNGINTVEAAEADNERFREKAASKGQAAEKQDIYDHAELEKRAWDNID